MSGLTFLAAFCLSVGGLTAAAYLILRRMRHGGSKAALAVGAGLLAPVVLVAIGLIILSSGFGSEPLEAAIHMFALAMVAAIVGLLTAATIAALKA